MTAAEAIRTYTTAVLRARHAYTLDQAAAKKDDFARRAANAEKARRSRAKKKAGV